MPCLQGDAAEGDPAPFTTHRTIDPRIGTPHETARQGNPPDDALHQIRILAKRSRYAAEAVAALVGPPAARFAATVADVQTVLGDHHDTVVAEAWLGDAAAADPVTGVAAGQLIAHERTQRDQLRAQWPAAWRTASAKKLRRWL